MPRWWTDQPRRGSVIVGVAADTQGGPQEYPPIDDEGPVNRLVPSVAPLPSRRRGSSMKAQNLSVSHRPTRHGYDRIEE